jgi:hypothetical protein
MTAKGDGDDLGFFQPSAPIAADDAMDIDEASPSKPLNSMKTQYKPPAAVEPSEATDTGNKDLSLLEAMDDEAESVAKEMDEIQKLHASGWKPVAKKKDYDLISDVYDRFLRSGQPKLVQELERLYFLENVYFF